MSNQVASQPPFPIPNPSKGGEKVFDPFGELKIFAGKASHDLALRIARYLGVELARSETILFSDGNVFVRILENVRGRDVYIVQGTEHPVNDNFMELLFWIDAFKRASATQVTAVIPYFSYAKGDKKDEPRVSIRARVCADAIEAAGADRVLTMDLHSPQIQGFFKVPVDHLLAMPVLVEHFARKAIPDLVVASPDVGFAKQAYKFAQMLNTGLVIGNKTRRDHTERAEIFEFIGSVEGKNVVIVDDFTISGGTLIEMAHACKARGAKEIYACVTHGVFAAGTAERVQKSPIKELVITDTIAQRDPSVIPSNCVIVSVAPMFAEAIGSIHRRESVSRLFQGYEGVKI
ncbi:ribose-phosphate pyrophosphokinase [Isosphaera pallida ATCC 43644]|jgi:ribose-phosphate pyrophosphokinase|uniref:ribose-phosphate diphosphokinase n=1 Tax=Isosphaera pallida (strain ATCC 43644 / DSM 9630 / IS1B) TaxID=575540 RepID=E8R1E7_ISOPI|nr:ribose-phosphate pyrophosphokinase [Isosphaera pallida]ADV62364.1 ribose-phosphate pyrophosphokinase [Isosphaera pallida ATCC 43644]